MDAPERFFAFARERHSIHIRRQSGSPRSEWTSDPVLSTYRFTNVFRELDRTTVWFREYVRDRLRDRPEVLLATVLFRWFNRIETGEALFCQPALGLEDELPGETAWDSLLRLQSVDYARAAIRQYCGRGPYVTGAYIIKSPDGMDKLDGVLWCVEQFMRLERSIGRLDPDADANDLDWQDVARVCLDHPGTVTMETVWDWLCQFPFMGPFMAYEVVTDLRHTALLERAPDIMTWANPGPGAMRGLNRIRHRQLHERVRRERLINEMQEILAWSTLAHMWPREWPAWEMRDVEHTLCEFDKYERARLGEGRPRGVYR